MFDLGGVVLRWEPHRAFVGVLDPGDVQPFLDEVDFGVWNHQHDAGRPFADGVRELSERFPQHAAAIAAYARNHHLTITGPIPETVAVIEELHRQGVRLFALTNWSAETFPHARRTFDVLQRFEAIVVSGEEGLAKPDPRIYRLLLGRYALDPADVVFVDDLPVNVSAAIDAGMYGHRFTGAAELRADLVRLRMLNPTDR